MSDYLNTLFVLQIDNDKMVLIDIKVLWILIFSFGFPNEFGQKRISSIWLFFVRAINFITVQILFFWTKQKEKLFCVCFFPLSQQLLSNDNVVLYPTFFFVG
jgi:hypothetical protein